MNKPPKSTGSRTAWLVAGVATLATFVGGAAAFLADADTIASRLGDRCIEWGVCEPGTHFVNGQVRIAPPQSPEISALFGTGDETIEPLVQQFTAAEIKGSSFSGMIVELAGGPGGQGERLGRPFQQGRQLGSFDPSTMDIGWKLGFPILDILIAEKGQAVDITTLDIDVLSYQRDETPYVQALTTYYNVGKILLVNESVHQQVKGKIEFTILGENPFQLEESAGCSDPNNWKDPDFKRLEYRLDVPAFSSEHIVDLGTFLAKELADFNLRNYRVLEHAHEDSDGPLPPKPTGYDEWNRGYDYEAMRESIIVYGRLVSEAVSAPQYESLFCVEVVVDPSDLGAGEINYQLGHTVELDAKTPPFTQTIDAMVRLDGDAPHYRTALLFHAKESGFYDITMAAKSFDRTVYKTNPMRLHVFVPKTTFAGLKLTITAGESVTTKAAPEESDP